MQTFEEIKPGARLRGLDPTGIAEVVSVSKFGSDAINLVFRVDGKVAERLVYRGEETSFEFVSAARAYAFDADGGLLRLASEAYRIRLAHLFDPYLAAESEAKRPPIPTEGGHRFRSKAASQSERRRPPC